MLLALRTQATVAFDIALGHSYAIVFIAAHFVVLFDAFDVFGLATFGHFLGDNMQRKQRISANLFDQHNQRGTLAGTGRNQTATFEQVFGILRDMKVA